MKPNRNTAAEIMQKDDSKGQARTAADSEQKDEDLFASQHSRKPNVGCSSFNSNCCTIYYYQKDYRVQLFNAVCRCNISTSSEFNINILGCLYEEDKLQVQLRR